MDDQVNSDDVDEVEIERPIDEEIDNFLASIPPFIDPDESL